MIQSGVIGMDRVESRSEGKTKAFKLSSWIKRYPSLKRNLVWASVATAIVSSAVMSGGYLRSSYLNDVPNSYDAVARTLTVRKALFNEDIKHLRSGSPASARKLAAIVVDDKVLATLPSADKPYSQQEIDQQFAAVAEKVQTQMRAMPDVPEIELQELNSIRVIMFKPSWARQMWNRMKDLVTKYTSFGETTSWYQAQRSQTGFMSQSTGEPLRFRPNMQYTFN